jgi:hypothetical protein
MAAGLTKRFMTLDDIVNLAENQKNSQLSN